MAEEQESTHQRIEMSGRMLKDGRPHLTYAASSDKRLCGLEEEVVALIERRFGQAVCTARRSQRVASSEGGEFVGAADVEAQEVESEAAVASHSPDLMPPVLTRIVLILSDPCVAAALAPADM